MRGNEVRTLNATVDSLKSVNEELKVDIQKSQFDIPSDINASTSVHLP